jgi:large subunit ribosomal protein L15
MPLHRRLPKRGFHSFTRVEYQVVNVRDLVRVEGAVTPESLHAAGLIGSGRRPVKILGNGDVESALTVEAHAFSGSAREKIEAAGGTATVLGGEDQ